MDDAQCKLSSPSPADWRVAPTTAWFADDILAN